jgi:hypothetical protein
MFSCCCNQGTELSYYVGWIVAGFTRWAGYCPFVLVEGTAVGSSNDWGAIETSDKPLNETLYRQMVFFYEALTPAGETELDHEWVRYTYKIHPQMGDGYYFRKETNDDLDELSYDLNDDGSTSGSAPDWQPDPDGLYTPGGGTTGPIEVSRTATEAVYKWTQASVDIIRLTVTLSDPVVPSDCGTVAETLRDVIDLTTPGDDYTPSGATKYTISGAERILTATPAEYFGTGNAAYYFEASQTYIILTQHARSGGGITTVHTLDSSYTAMRPSDGLSLALTNSLRVFNFPIGETITNYPKLMTSNQVFRTKGKLLADGSTHRWTTTMEHSGGPAEDAEYWQGWDMGTLAERGTFARRLTGVTPPAQWQDSVFGTPTDLITWLPYYALVEDDQAESTETQRGATIQAALI